jgi:2-isopropylmalate synthase
MKKAKYIQIFDTTLRDGEQSPHVQLNSKEKLEIARQLAKLRVDVIEAGFPIASPGEFEAVKLVAQEVKGPVIAGLARALTKDIKKAWEAIKDNPKPRIHTFISTSDIHIKAKLKKTKKEVLKMAEEAVKYATSLCPEVEFSPEDAVRTDPEYLFEVIAAVIEAGARVINIPDTVGYSTPLEFGRLIKEIVQRVPSEVVISVHCHNDLGMATANSLVAVQNGASQIECTINGIGERAGNAALEEVVMALRTRRDFFNCTTRIKTTEITRTSKLVSTLTGIYVQPNKAVVGENAFSHEAGIHQDGILKERTTYEIMTPQSVGRGESKLVLGKHSGRHAFKNRLRKLGHRLKKEEIDRLFQKFLELADKKKEIFDEDLEALVEDQLLDIPPIFALEYIHITAGNKTVPTATVRIKKEGKIIEDAACGDGPVDAAYKTIDRLTGLKVKLVDYSIKAITSGKDALGEASIKVEYQNKLYASRATSTDIIEASVLAYLNVINKIVVRRKVKKVSDAAVR